MDQNLTIFLAPILIFHRLRSAPRLLGSAVVSWPVRMIAPPFVVTVSGAPPG
jgi:hypothetical protein